MLPQSTAHHGKMKRSLYRNKILWCPGAGSNHRHCDFQSHALPTELPGHCPARGRERRFIVRPGGPVHHASTSASRGAAARRSPQGDDGPLQKRGANCTKTLEYCSFGVFVVILRRERRRSRTASGSGRHPGSARNRTGARPRWPACRRSGKAFLPVSLPAFSAVPCRARHRLAAQLAFNQPKRIGKPSPPSSVIDS